MKKNLFPFLTTVLVALVFTSGAYAQLATVNPAFNHHSIVAAMPYESDLDGHFFATTRPFDINIKAVRDFTQSFKQAENVQWYKVTDGLMAYFTENGIKMRSGYDSKGNWLYSMRFYAEASLPKDIRAEVKSIFYDYSITWINEITKEQKIVYLVHLQDKKHWKTIRVCEGEEIETVEDFDEI